MLDDGAVILIETGVMQPNAKLQRVPQIAVLHMQHTQQMTTGTWYMTNPDC